MTACNNDDKLTEETIISLQTDEINSDDAWKTVRCLNRWVIFKAFVYENLNTNLWWLKKRKWPTVCSKSAYVKKHLAIYFTKEIKEKKTVAKFRNLV